MKSHTYCYPAVITYEQDMIAITFPDLPGLTSVAHNDYEIIGRAREALGGHICVMEDYGEKIPEAIPMKDVPLESNQRCILVDAYTPYFRMMSDTKAVNKTLTLPRWMAQMADQEGIKLSAVLQEALREQLRIPHP